MFQVRTYTENDLAALVSLMRAINAADDDELIDSVEEWQEQFSRPNFVPEQNVFLVQNDRRALVAMGQLHFSNDPDEQGFRTSFQVHPDWRGQGVEDLILARLEARARERIGEARSENVYLGTGTREPDVQARRAAERAGMREIRRFWLMTRDNLDELSRPQFPTGLVARPFRLGEDDEPSRLAVNDAFSEHFGYTEETPEVWNHFIHSPRFRPDLSVVVQDTNSGQIAGYSLNMVNPYEHARLGSRRGWVEILGVRRAYRRQGLGEATLIQGMLHMRDAGMDHAALGCDAENTTGATRLYFRVGFKMHRTTVLYFKRIREASP